MKLRIPNDLIVAHKLAAACVLMLLAGCATNAVTIMPMQQKGFYKSPEQNTRVKVSVGDVLYEESDTVEQQIAMVLQPIQVRAMVTGNVINNKLVLSNVNGRQLYCGTAMFSDSRLQSICLIDTNNSNAFDKILWVNTLGDGEETLKQPAQYIPNKKEIISGYRQELIYQGRVGNSISLLYREYSGDLARPAYSQTVTYEVNTSAETKASFRGLNITIYGANNSGVEFSVSGQIRRTQ